jgi:RHS repeat-associated protein
VSGDGTWINREEYFPYGETSFGSFRRKRYRFSAKERDEESGLEYHGARYYAPNACRWISIDPSPEGNPRIHSYAYCECRPTVAVDLDGRNPILLGLFIALFLMPNTANAPGPKDPLYPSMSEGEFCAQFTLIWFSGGTAGAVEKKLAYHIGESALGRTAAGLGGGMVGGGLFGGGTVGINDAFMGKLSPPERYAQSIALGMFFGAAMGGISGRLSPAPPQLSERAMARFLMRTYNETPVLQDLGRVWQMEPGAARMEAMANVVRRFSAETGIKIEVVKPGAVQTATGTRGNYASLHSRPGYLQIEGHVGAQGVEDQLLTEITHELSFYYTQRAWSFQNAPPGAIPMLKPGGRAEPIHQNQGSRVMDDIVENQGATNLLAPRQ